MAHWHHENTVVLLLQLPEDQICSKPNRYSFKLSLQVVSWGKILSNDMYSMCDRPSLFVIYDIAGHIAVHSSDSNFMY